MSAPLQRNGNHAFDETGLASDDFSAPAEPLAAPSPGQGSWFATTHWSVVTAAGHNSGTTGREALEALCRAYWPPLYAFARRLGHSPHDAEDLVQSFFARLLACRLIESADRAKGRFRSFLLAAFKHFLANEWEKRRAAKRGSGVPVLSFDAMAAEAGYLQEPATELTPDRLYDRRWALTLLGRVMSRLEDEQNRLGRGESFGHLKQALTAPRSGVSHADLGRRLGMTEGAVKVAVHRLRRRYRQLLEAEIAQTVSTPAEVEGERRELLAALHE